MEFCVFLSEIGGFESFAYAVYELPVFVSVWIPGYVWIELLYRLAPDPYSFLYESDSHTNLGMPMAVPFARTQDAPFTLLLGKLFLVFFLRIQLKIQFEADILSDEVVTVAFLLCIYWN